MPLATRVHGVADLFSCSPLSLLTLLSLLVAAFSLSFVETAIANNARPRILCAHNTEQHSVSSFAHDRFGSLGKRNELDGVLFGNPINSTPSVARDVPGICMHWVLGPVRWRWMFLAHVCWDECRVGFKFGTDRAIVSRLFWNCRGLSNHVN